MIVYCMLDSFLHTNNVRKSRIVNGLAPFSPQIKVGIYDTTRNRVVVSSGEWIYFYEVRSSIDK